MSSVQDDPNFFAWLDGWIGKQDEDTIITDAFATLTDLGAQFEWQQQQQQQQDAMEDQQRPQQGGSAHGTGDAGDATMPSSFPVGSSLAGAAPTYTPLTARGMAAAAPAAAADRTAGASNARFSGDSHFECSSCASMASHPSAGPSDCHTLATSGSGGSPLGSPGLAHRCSSNGIEPVGSAAAPPNPFRVTIETTAGTPPPLQPVHPFLSQTAAAASLGGGGAGLSAAGSIQLAYALGLAAGASLPQRDGLPAAGPQPSLLQDLSSFLQLHSAGALAPAGADPHAHGPDPHGQQPGSGGAAHMPSHGTISSFAGTPPPPQRQPSAAVPASALPVAAVAATAAAAPATADASAAAAVLHAGIVSVPSLEQLLAVAMQGNGAAGPRRPSAATAGGGGGAATATTTTTTGGRSIAATLAAAAAVLRGGGAGAGSGSGLDAAGGLSFRWPSGELGANTSMRSGGEDAAGLWSRSTSGLSDGAGGAGAGPYHRRSKTSSTGFNPHQQPHQSGHHPGRGIPVAHALGHGHVSKSSHGGSGGAGGGGGSGGRQTRSARSKALFAALEAEAAGKLEQLEALRKERSTLLQRMEILEVAVERQSAVLGVMQAAGGAADGAEGGAADLAAVALTPALNGLGGFFGSLGMGEGGGMAALVAGSMPSGAAGQRLLEWARTVSLEGFVAVHKAHIQELSLALLALEGPTPDLRAEETLVRLVSQGCLRAALLCLFQPLHLLRLKHLNLESGQHAEASDAHWLEVIKFMSVPAAEVGQMEDLFHSYNLLHGTFTAELQDTQRELAELIRRGGEVQGSGGCCSMEGLAEGLQQFALAKRVRSILSKTHLLYSCTITVAALRILRPKEFAKCCVQSYPYYPCGVSLMRACHQLKVLKALGVNVCPC